MDISVGNLFSVSKLKFEKIIARQISVGERSSEQTLTGAISGDIRLAHNILMDSSNVICWTSPFVTLGVMGLFCGFNSIFDGKSCYVDPDQTPYYMESNLGLHCLPITFLQVSR